MNMLAADQSPLPYRHLMSELPRHSRTRRNAEKPKHGIGKTG